MSWPDKGRCRARLILRRSASTCEVAGVRAPWEGAATTTPFSARGSFAGILSKSASAGLPAPLQRAAPLLVAHFKQWLRKHRGVSDATIKLYARDAAHLMAALGEDPGGWEPAAIRSFFLDCAGRCGEGTIEKLTTSLRAFLRYLAVEGRCQAGLADVVPGYAHWRLADLPRFWWPSR